MQITSYYPNVSINTANPPTEQARRDMQRRELVEPVREMEKGAAERGISSDERSRGAATNNPTVTLYDSNGKETETQQAIAGREEESSSSDQQASSEQQSAEQEQTEQQANAEQQELRELQARDQEVRAHEQAHATVGGRYAGTPSYDYQQGPDGRRYAVGGEVQIDLAPVANDPQATIQKMQQVKAAALAPAEPSAADRSIASEATNRLLQAQADLIAERSQQLNSAANNTPAPATSSTSTVASTADSTVGSDTTVADIVMPQRERLERSPLMQQRSAVIQNFYQLATEPSVKQYLQQA
ncbi:putative metalloprotease CJM1_0395 family protein [Alishewanella longhuensis]